MSLSIIIPALNEADGIVETLSSLQPLRARGSELIVVDGGSSDDTPRLAQPLSDSVLGAPRGRARQMNAGAARATREILLFLHADCRLPDGADALVTDGLHRHRAGWGRFDVAIDSTRPSLRMVGAMMNARSRLTGIATGDQALFMTRSLFDASGGYADLPLMEDIEFTRRLKRYGPPLCLRHRVTVSPRRWEKHGVLRTVVLMWRLRFAYWAGSNPASLAARYVPHRE